MRTLTSYGVAGVIVLAILNGIVRLLGDLPQIHGVHVFSAGFIVGMFWMYLKTWLQGYRQ